MGATSDLHLALTEGERIEALEAKCALLSASLMRADKAREVMLSALKEVEEWADEECDINDNGGPNDAMRLREVVRAAINKAARDHIR